MRFVEARQRTARAERTVFRLAAAMVLLVSVTAMAGMPKATPAKPNASLAPPDVVRIQLDALRHVDEPSRDAGFAIVFAFASPGNQEQTGPLAHFAGMIRGSYGDLLNHRSATLEALKLEGNQAIQGVQIVDHAGSIHHYVFILSKQAGPACAGCWLTDGVVGDPNEKPAEEI